MCTRLNANYYLLGLAINCTVLAGGRWGGDNDLTIYCCHCGVSTKRNLTPFATTVGCFSQNKNARIPVC